MHEIFAIIEVRVPTAPPNRALGKVSEDTAAIVAGVDALRAAAVAIHPAATVAILRQRINRPRKVEQPIPAPGADSGSGADSETGGGAQPDGESLPAAAQPSGDDAGGGAPADQIKDPAERTGGRARGKAA